jgi:menaquinone-9 beta-reductase
MSEVVIIGAGLAGLSCGLQLNRNGFRVTIIEKQSFPFHKVCGEYVSNEVLPFLASLGIEVNTCHPSRLDRLKVTSPSGLIVEMPLDLGGFGLSRYCFDELLYKACLVRGIEFLTATKVTDVRFCGAGSVIELSDNRQISAALVIGAYGKRSNLDQRLSRRFFFKRSPYMAVKYHIRTDFPEDLIQLDIFPGGYSGICKIEGDRYSLCYLSRTENLRQHRQIRDMEEQVLFRNPCLKEHYKHAEFVSGPAEVISQVSFERKSLTEGHMLFCGDSAGMISPLFGNGMALAIRNGKMLADLISAHLEDDPALNHRAALERLYEKEWERQFRHRIHAGRVVQNVFLQPFLAETGLRALHSFPGLARRVLKYSHGRPF